MAISKRQEIEDAVITALSALLRPTKYLAAIDAYNGELDRFEGADDVRAALSGVPGILVAGGDGRYSAQGTTRRRFAKQIQIELLLVSAHGRAQHARTRADAAAQASVLRDPGVYLIEEDVFSLLAGEDLGIDTAGQLMPVAETLLFELPDLTARHVTYNVTHDVRKTNLDHGTEPLSGYRIETNLEDGEPLNPLAEREKVY